VSCMTMADIAKTYDRKADVIQSGYRKVYLVTDAMPAKVIVSNLFFIGKTITPLQSNLLLNMQNDYNFCINDRSPHPGFSNTCCHLNFPFVWSGGIDTWFSVIIYNVIF
jgi:hypothetical protein